MKSSTPKKGKFRITVYQENWTKKGNEPEILHEEILTENILETNLAITKAAISNSKSDGVAYSLIVELSGTDFPAWKVDPYKDEQKFCGFEVTDKKTGKRQLEGDDGGGMDEAAWDSLPENRELAAKFSEDFFKKQNPEFAAIFEKYKTPQASKAETNNDPIHLLIEMFSLGSEKAYQDVEEACLQLIERDPNRADLWSLRAKALLELNRDEEALHDIIAACKIEPSNGRLGLQYFMVRMKRAEYNFIPSFIEHKFKGLDSEGQDLILGFVEVALKCGMFSKFQLAPFILDEIIIRRERKSNG